MPSKNSDQPGHPRSLISLGLGLYGSQGIKATSSGQQIKYQTVKFLKKTISDTERDNTTAACDAREAKLSLRKYLVK